MRQIRGNWTRPARFRLNAILTAKGALPVLRIWVSGGRLPSRDQQPGKLDLRLLRLSFDELNQKFPFVAVVEEESHLGPERRKGLEDTCPLDAPCVTLALSDIDKELIPDGRATCQNLDYPVFHAQTRNVAKIRLVVGHENGVAADCMGGDHPIVIAPACPTALGNDPAIGHGG